MAKTKQSEESRPAANYIAVRKGGEVIRIHPSQVEQHVRLGWSVEE